MNPHLPWTRDSMGCRKSKHKHNPMSFRDVVVAQDVNILEFQWNPMIFSRLTETKLNFWVMLQEKKDAALRKNNSHCWTVGIKELTDISLNLTTKPYLPIRYVFWQYWKQFSYLLKINETLKCFLCWCSSSFSVWLPSFKDHRKHEKG